MADKLVVVQKDVYWGAVEESASPAVVWIIAQIQDFNWYEPYAVGEQYESRGTGFLINQDGYIVTTLHVVNDSLFLWVVLPQWGKKYIKAELVSLCSERDLAILRINPQELTVIKADIKELPVLSFGNSDEVRRADSVLSLSYPLGHGQLKGTTGVISGREWLQGQLMLQMTAPINQGSSGGPVLNSMGQVIGITIAMDLNAQNVGYAIAINELLLVLDEMYKNKFARKPVFGARFVQSNDEKAAFLSNPVPSGLYISGVISGGLFDKAGIRVGDMLYAFGQFQLDAYGDAVVPWSKERQSLQELASRVVVGDMVSFLIYRHGQRMEIPCLVTADNPFLIYKRFPMIEKIEYENVGGLVFMDLAENHLDILIPEAPHLAIYTKAEEKVKGVVIVSAVVAGSYAYQFRSVKPGDVLYQINGEPVSSLDQCRLLLRKSVANDLLSLMFQDGVLVVFSRAKMNAVEQEMQKL